MRQSNAKIKCNDYDGFLKMPNIPNFWPPDGWTDGWMDDSDHDLVIFVLAVKIKMCINIEKVYICKTMWALIVLSSVATSSSVVCLHWPFRLNIGLLIYF